MFNDKFHQIAIYHPNPGLAVHGMRTLNYHEWTRDTARLSGEVHGTTVECYAEMFFNYQWGPNELEFLRYDGMSWHSYGGRTTVDGLCTDPFLSHKSVYVDDCFDGEESKLLKEAGFVLVQWFETFDHTNQYLIDKRQRFKETIWDTRMAFGFDTKLIERIAY